MTERRSPPRPPKPVADGKVARRAAALRLNLARRKAQKRARGADEGGPKEQG